MAPGADTLVWYNLNQSNYIGVDHICELWEMLRAAMGGMEAKCEAFDESVTVTGDLALVTYLMHFAADFGALGKFVQDARDTEVTDLRPVAVDEDVRRLQIAVDDAGVVRRGHRTPDRLQDLA